MLPGLGETRAAQAGAAVDADQAVAQARLYNEVFQLLTGALPYRNDSMAALMRAIGREPPTPLASLRPDLPPALGDIVALVEQVTAHVDMQAAQKMAAKLKSGDGFDLNDFLSQLQQMRQMGGLSSLMEKLPGQIAAKAKDVDLNRAEKEMLKKQGIIHSMTPMERAKPDIIKATRKRRIAAGAGVQVQEVNRLLNEFGQMQEMMKKMRGGGLMKMMKRMGGMKGMPGMGGGFPGMR